MSTNVGRTEQIIRFVLGVVLLALGSLHVVAGAWAIGAYVVGAAAIVTGILRYCPTWSIVGINTCEAAHR